MIFLFGTRESILHSVPTPGHACPSCANTQALRLVMVSRYAHLFFVPLFATSRRLLLVCGHCQLKGPESAIPAALRPTAEQLKKQIGRPWWQYLGLGLVGLLLVVVAFVALNVKPKAESDKEELLMLNAPQVNDVYIIEAGRGDQVSMLRVQRVVPDTVYVQASKVVESSFMAYQHSHNPASYQPQAYAMSISSLRALHRSQVLRTVRRD